MDIGSSPLSSPPPTQSFSNDGTARAPAIKFRPTKELPFELGQHVQTYYEEALFLQAFNFLQSITSNSVSLSNPSAPVIIPPPTHLALAATIAIHPILTTRTISQERREQSGAAFRYLRLVHKLVGPVNAKITQAFQFNKYTLATSNKNGKVNRDDDDDYNDEAQNNIDLDKLNTPYADHESVWSRSEDFWQVVGWSLNCSCLPNGYDSRWQYWNVWLEFMIDVLETDWQLHLNNDSIKYSLLWQYTKSATKGNAQVRRFLRAIFADGTTKSLNEFREIFYHELKPPPKEADKLKKRQVDVNIDQDIFGDYLAQDSDVSDDLNDTLLPRPTKRLRTRITPRASSSNLRDDSENASNANNLGGPRSINIRLRLLNLLYQISVDSNSNFLSSGDLTAFFVEFIKPLPILVFQQFISTATISSETLSSPAHTTICTALLYRTLEPTPPSPYSTLPSFSTFIESYLPCNASRSTSIANAQASLLLECLLRRLWTSNQLPTDQDSSEYQNLVNAVETGIRNRANKAVVRTRGRPKAKTKPDETNDNDDDEEPDTQAPEEQAAAILAESAERMRRVLNLICSKK